MFKIEKYENCSASDYYDAVIGFPDQAAEAVYYLLRQRLSRALHRVYELHGLGLDDHYDDTIDDFFLFLYAYNDKAPFAVLVNLHERQAFFGWIVGTYRHFLNGKVRDEIKRRMAVENAHAADDEEGSPFTDEKLMGFIAKAIAYADQELTADKRFLLYRMLLTILNPKLAIPQEEVAHALKMHPVTYRVSVNRLRSRLSDDITRLEGGQSLPLDVAHLLMSSRLLNGFDHLYNLLMPYYETALHELACASAINELRNGFSGDGIVMHESTEYHYPHRVDVRRLYHLLKSYSTASRNRP